MLVIHLSIKLQFFCNLRHIMAILCKFASDSGQLHQNQTTMKHEISINSLDDLGKAAEQFLKEAAGHTIIAFYAPMGAGKTTFTTAICHQLGVSEDAVSSPTFSIVNEYKAADRSSIFHFDFYRINKLEEAFDIGFYDYVDSGSLCLIEWPENIESILPEETLKVQISVQDNGSRTVSWED